MVYSDGMEVQMCEEQPLSATRTMQERGHMDGRTAQAVLLTAPDRTKSVPSSC